eukprot:TRINITY_DN3594_c1_g2_i3.p1 TRINITY_DN3594_c1_g2~~TRINITY_DN3594_c1_g2_i3.p1  ORF type:complete len:142 (-),score=9.00 TRINITY_DN3594_c1_g2_i3:61-486(-)
MNVVTVASLLIIKYIFVLWFLDIISEIRWEKWNTLDEESSDIIFKEKIRNYTMVRDHMKAILNDVRRIRNENIHRFTIHMSSFFLIIAYIGSLVSGYLLCHIIVYGALLLPCAVRFGVYDTIMTTIKSLYDYAQETLTIEE